MGRQVPGMGWAGGGQLKGMSGFSRGSVGVISGLGLI
jgi:hypothetical protein